VNKALRVRRGIKVILKYEPEADVCAEHDIFYCGDTDLPDKMTPEDKAIMEDIFGWHICSDIGGWGIFV